MTDVKKMTDKALDQEERDLTNRLQLVQEERRRRTRTFTVKLLGADGAQRSTRKFRVALTEPTAVRKLFEIKPL